jgi:hypothetical protein
MSGALKQRMLSLLAVASGLIGFSSPSLGEMDTLFIGTMNAGAVHAVPPAAAGAARTSVTIDSSLNTRNGTAARASNLTSTQFGWITYRPS